MRWTYPVKAKVYLRWLIKTYPNRSLQRELATCLQGMCNTDEASLSKSQAETVGNDILGLARLKERPEAAVWIAAVYAIGNFINSCRG